VQDSGLKTIAIVGASLAGLRAAETLRSEGFDGRLILVGSETRLPYDRPPLTKEILRGQWDEDRIGLRRAPWEELDLDMRLGRTAVRLRPEARTLELDDGATIAYDGAIIATGASARRLPNQPDMDGLFTIRSLDDALALREALENGPRVAVLGAGFIGAEIAASARAMGCEVTMIDMEAAPMVRGLGLELGGIAGTLHRDNGVELRLGVGAAKIEGASSVEGVALTDGSLIESDVVVVGIGVSPNTQWLADSGIALNDGVLCDQTCATSVDNVVAAGDVARWRHPHYDEPVRFEHWTNAVEQAVHAAKRLLHGPSVGAFAPIPLFWTDQFGVKIQVAGTVGATDEVCVVEGDPAKYRFAALVRRGSKLGGVVTFRRARLFIKYSQMIADGLTWDEALEAAKT
jgi:NADPH-dependent 2,4-dienoyl-CoA reductase/sulfur reductase-like enzyme